MKIMIVDDEPKIRNGLLKLLGARKGWQVRGVFENAHSALTALYDQEADVIVTDIKMPEVSGLELIRRIREQNQHIRIVILSGHSNFIYAQKAIALGVTRYLLKPTNPKELIAVLEGIEKELDSEGQPIAAQMKEGMKKGETIDGSPDSVKGEQEKEAGNLLVMKAKQYVEVHYSGKITLKDMSEALHLSPNYLCELFKRRTGKNIMEYVAEFRMRKAKTYLGNIEYKVSDIAEMVGYKEAKYFSSAFKKEYGMTPMEYRNKKAQSG